MGNLTLLFGSIKSEDASTTISGAKINKACLGDMAASPNVKNKPVKIIDSEIIKTTG